MTFPKATDNWTGYYVDHTYGQTPAGGLSQYTMMFDLRVPQSSFSTDAYMALFETNSSNGSAGDLFVGLTAAGRQGAIGISTIGYSSPGVIQPDTWHRVAWVYDQSNTVNPNDRTASIYVDGVLVHQSLDTFTTDSRFRPHYVGLPGSDTIINPMQGFFLATSNTPGENSSADLASFLFVNRPMTQLEVQSLGGASANGLLDAVSQAPGVNAVHALSPAHYYRLNETAADTATPSVIDSGGVPITALHAGNFGAGGAQAGANGVWLPGFEKGNVGIFHNDKGAVDLGAGSNFAAEKMTVSLWFKVDDPTFGVGGTFADRIFHNNDATHPFSISAWQDASGVDRGLVLANGSGSSNDAMLPASTLNLFDGRWHHIVAVRHSGSNVGGLADVSLFVNGVNYSTDLRDSNDGWGSTGSTAWIGTRSLDSVGNFAGSTDEVAIWLNRELTTSEAAGLYNAARTPASLPRYASTVLDRDPVAYYRFQEPAGIAAGETVVNWANQGTTSVNVLGDANAGFDEFYPETAPTFDVTGPQPADLINGRALNGLEADNTAARFFGYETGVANSADLVNIGNNPALLDNPELSYSLLFNVTSNYSYMRMIATDSETANTFHVIMHEGKLILVSNNETATTADAYNDGEWHHLVAIRTGDDALDLSLFVDGAPVSLTAGDAAGYSNPSTTRIGARDGGTTAGMFIGMLDEVAIWNRALNSTDVRALYNALTIPEPGSAMLLALGALAALLFRGRRRGHYSWLIALAIVVVPGTLAQADVLPVAIEMVTVNAANNSPSSTNLGAVSYVYRIGKHEVTNNQYVSFLNAVAKTDTHNLYAASMGSDSRGGITRTGASGAYVYEARVNMGDKPVGFVSWYDALRFVNWLHNGQPQGLQDAFTTEDGAYTFSGATTVGSRNAGAMYWLPSEDEWYKAAYFDAAKPGGAGYWLYPTGSDTTPGTITANSTGDGSAGSTGNYANYGNVTTWNGLTGHITTVGTNGGPSPFGTFDQGGNSWEWTDSKPGTNPLMRGGSAGHTANRMASTDPAAAGDSATTESYRLTFRVASVPEPGSALLLLFGAAAGLLWRRREG